MSEPFSTYYSALRGSNLLARTRYMAPGTYTMRVPDIPCFMDVMLVGGGGGGAVGVATSLSASSRMLVQGANGPDIAYVFNRSVRPGDVFTVVVGGGGPAAYVNTINTVSPGGNGANSSMVGPGIDMEASGGLGGVGTYNGAYGMPVRNNPAPAKTLGVTAYCKGFPGGEIETRSAANALYGAVSGGGAPNPLGLASHNSKIAASTGATRQYAVSAGCSVRLPGQEVGGSTLTFMTAASTGELEYYIVPTTQYPYGGNALDAYPDMVSAEGRNTEITPFGLEIVCRGTRYVNTGSWVFSLGGGGLGMISSTAATLAEGTGLARSGAMGGAGGVINYGGSDNRPFETTRSAPQAASGVSGFLVRSSAGFSCSNGGAGFAIINFRT